MRLYEATVFMMLPRTPQNPQYVHRDNNSNKNQYERKTAEKAERQSLETKLHGGESTSLLHEHNYEYNPRLRGNMKIRVTSETLVLLLEHRWIDERREESSCLSLWSKISKNVKQHSRIPTAMKIFYKYKQKVASQKFRTAAEPHSLLGKIKMPRKWVNTPRRAEN